MELYANGITIDFGDNTRALSSNLLLGRLFPVTIEHTVADGETLMSIAHRYYKDTENWWVIGEANPNVNPVNPELGTAILIPQI